MKKSILALLVITLLTACNSKKEEALILDLEKSYAKTAEFSHEISELHLNLLEACYAQNPEKVKRFYNKAIKVHEIAQEFYWLADKIIFDTISTNFPLNELKIKYNTVVDTLISYMDKRNLDHYKIKKNEYPEKPYYKSYLRHTAMMMKNDVSIYESTIIRLLYSNVICRSNYYYKEVTIDIYNNSNASSYMFNLNSYCLQQQHYKDINVVIDSLLYNGNLIKKEATITPIFNFSNVRLDSLEKGKYEIRGRVRIISELGGVPDYPFNHKFEIKDE